MFSFSEYFKPLETPDSWKKDSVKPIRKRDKYGEAGDCRIVGGRLISDKSMNYTLVNLIPNKFKEFN